MTPASALNSSHAQIERTEQVSGLRLIECRYHPDLRMPKHWHDYAHFVLVLEGACTDACRGGLGCTYRRDFRLNGRKSYGPVRATNTRGEARSRM